MPTRIRRGEEALEELFRRSDGVLISPSSHEGLDLYDDRCRFQIIIKIPYASLGDPVIQARMKSDRHYYAIITTQKLIQACGRGVRSNFDFANTYISDSDFNRFFGNAESLFPHT